MCPGKRLPRSFTLKHPSFRCPPEPRPSNGGNRLVVENAETPACTSSAKATVEGDMPDSTSAACRTDNRDRGGKEEFERSPKGYFGRVHNCILPSLDASLPRMGRSNIVIYHPKVLLPRGKVLYPEGDSKLSENDTRMNLYTKSTAKLLIFE